ncbi:MAG: NirD/YgiW/YdeI family stress tolerance protein [Deltaproteobacteria bacterium]|jgi:uncharacterized protein (TIGR00156 family)|nr:NirD/YgiW/YdeI family stress tolerance protein [Deltaproteobacteria bacterium]
MNRFAVFAILLLSAFALVATAGALFAQGGFQSQEPPKAPDPAKPQGGFQSPESARPQGGFQGPGIDVISVSQAVRLRDDTFVILRGKIVRSIGKDKFVFQDQTGDIIVEIDSHLWGGETVTPDDLLEIGGEIDKEFMGDVELDVHKLTKLK